MSWVWPGHLVNFHQKPGGDTVGQADPNWPNRTGYSIPCAVMLGSGGVAGRGEGSCSSGALMAVALKGGVRGV